MAAANAALPGAIFRDAVGVVSKPRFARLYERENLGGTHLSGSAVASPYQFLKILELEIEFENAVYKANGRIF